MIWEVISIVVAVAALVISIVSARTAREANERATTLVNKEERRYKIGVLTRCASMGTELSALNEAYAAFHDSHAVGLALQRFYVGLEQRRQTQPGRKKSGPDISGTIKQILIDRLKKELIEAMCEDTGVDYGVVSGATGFTEEQLTRHKHKSMVHF